MSATQFVQLTGTTIEEIDKLLGEVEIEVRQSLLSRSLRSGLTITRRVAKAILPKPGYPGDKPGLAPLRDAVQIKVKTYPSGIVVGMIGYRWPEGAHGHLPEDGHRIVIRGVDTGKISEAKKYLAKSVEQTEVEVNSHVVRFVESRVQQKVA